MRPIPTISVSTTRRLGIPCIVQPYALENRLPSPAPNTWRSWMTTATIAQSCGYQKGGTRSSKSSWQAPLYWQRSTSDASGWQVFTLGGYRGLSELLETPVCHVSLFEADAFARWRGCRLPTEAEWENAAAPAACQTETCWKPARCTPTAATTRVSLIADVRRLLGVDCVRICGLSRLCSAAGCARREYNGKFMSSSVILRGGSALTPASHIRASYRNFFSPATRWQMSGIRLARTFSNTR